MTYFETKLVFKDAKVDNYLFIFLKEKIKPIILVLGVPWLFQ